MKERNEKLKKRVYAFFIDILAISMIEKAIFFTFMSFAKNSFIGEGLGQKLSTQYHLINYQLILITYFSYFFLSLYMGNGKTLGKTIMGLRVIGKDYMTQQLSAFESFFRAFGYTICYGSALLLFLIPFFKEDTKGIPDWISQSEVLTDLEFEEKIYQLTQQEEWKKISLKTSV